MSEKFIDLKISRFKGVEYLNVYSMEYDAKIDKPYKIELNCSYSGNDKIKTEELIGKDATVTLSDVNGEEKKYLHGIVTDVQQGNEGMNWNKETFYKDMTIIIEPMVSMMALHHNTRVFSSGNVINYIEKIAKDYSINKLRPPGDCSRLIEREFCIQYNETDLNFLKRLLESEGIFYYFRHTKDGCTWELGSSVADYNFGDKIKFGSGDENFSYSSIGKGNRVLPKLDVICDYDFNFPQKQLLSDGDVESSSKNVLSNEIVKNYTYPYPARSFMDPTKNQNNTIGNHLAKRRLESHVSRHEVLKLEVPGIWQKFDVAKEINIAKKKGPFVITEYNLTITINPNGAPSVHSSITAIDTEIEFCPPLETPIPHVPSQTAVVIGSSEGTIYNKTDKEADRNIFAKVKFHWDINSKHTNQSNECSCWIRVAQPWAGPNRGFIFPPRVGDEVVITFESGHPDMPIITGGVFNKESFLPYSLKDNKNVSGIVSQTIGKCSSRDRSSAILFKDDAGQEEFHLLTKGDLINIVEKSVKQIVTESLIQEIKKDILVRVGGSHKEQIEKDLHLKAKNSICLEVGGNFVQVKPDKVLIAKEVDANCGDTAPNIEIKELEQESIV